jgi:ribosomal protein S18 acetylase RimI-like enzyme
MDFKIRKGEPADHDRIVAVMKHWWDGRDLTAMLPKLFLNHFHDTALVMEKENALIGFFIGLLSQSYKDEAYIHFVGIHPKFRKKGLARRLYEQFFDICRKHHRTTVRACTSPANKGSVEFHKKMGFQMEPGNGEMDGIPVTYDYNRVGDHKVLFRRRV